MAHLLDQLTIRRETPEDATAVGDLLDAAFDHAPGTHRSVESVLVEELDAEGDVIGDLSFVAELGGEIVAQVLCSRATMGEHESVALGPIAVRPDLQRQGIGAALMASVIATADQRADPAIVLLGDPDYYGHFGFAPGEAHGIQSPDPSWGEHFMVKRLRAWRPELAGQFRYPSAFQRL